jgi:hypothetical protein
VKLPDGQRAVVDIAKLRDYCLDPGHPRGRFKARVFASALGLTQADAEPMRRQLLLAARDGDAALAGRDEYGERYTIDFDLTHGTRRARIRSAWIILRGEGIPRLISCYVLLD